MPLPPVIRPAHRFGGLALAALLSAGSIRADEPVAVFAEVFNGYARMRLPDKSFKPEAYVFGEGGCWSRPVRDAAMEEMTFLKVARAVAAPLASQNYFPARTSAEAELLVLVFWGSTEGSRDHDRSQASDQLTGAMSELTAARQIEAGKGDDSKDVASAAETDRKNNPATKAAADKVDAALWMQDLQNRDRDQLDARNARILGYTDVLDRARFAGNMSFAKDILVEIGDNRYYVVLQAYDFRTAGTEKKLKPLWTARISVNEGGVAFPEALDHMARHAARYLGQDSNGLHRAVNREGRVDLAPTQILGTSPAK